MAVLDAELRARRHEPAARTSASTRDRIPSGVSVGIFDTIDELLSQVQGYVDDGYVRIKLKIEPGWDLEPVRLVRELIGPDMPLQVDANTAYSRDRHRPPLPARRVRPAADRAAARRGGHPRVTPSWPRRRRRRCASTSRSCRPTRPSTRSTSARPRSSTSSRAGSAATSRRVGSTTCASSAASRCGAAAWSRPASAAPPTPASPRCPGSRCPATSAPRPASTPATSSPTRSPSSTATSPSRPARSRLRARPRLPRLDHDVHGHGPTVASIVVVAYPCRSNSRWAASRIDRRVAAACACRRGEW